MSTDAVVAGSINSPAIIGKLPGHGDFLARSVEYALRDPLDRWMSEWLELARAKLGSEFEEAYESAAPWLWEGANVNAVFMPSVDAVGRLFPLLVVCSSSAVTQDIYDTIVGALEAGTKADALIDQLQELVSRADPVRTPDRFDWFLPEGAEPMLPSPSTAKSWPSIREHFS
ncbi:MAG: type VI secretion system-associated protein TagF [Pseudomonadota bacterium]